MGSFRRGRRLVRLHPQAMRALLHGLLSSFLVIDDTAITLTAGIESETSGQETMCATATGDAPENGLAPCSRVVSKHYRARHA